jgi:hypothetical protein
MRLAPRLYSAGYPRERISSGSGAGGHAPPIRPARPPDALQFVALYLLFVVGGLVFKSPFSTMK